MTAMSLSRLVTVARILPNIRWDLGMHSSKLRTDYDPPPCTLLKLPEPTFL